MHQKEYWERKELDARRSPEHPVVAAYVLPKIDMIRRYVPIGPETTLLDVGCGNGFFTYHFDNCCSAMGVDYSEKMLSMNPVPRKALMEAGNLQFADNSFDVVFCHALLHHVEDPWQVVSEMRRVSRGHVVILEPNRNNPLMFLFAAAVKEERGALSFSARSLRRLALKAGLVVEEAFSYGLIVPNKTPTALIGLTRLLDRRMPLGMTAFLIARKQPG